MIEQSGLLHLIGGRVDLITGGRVNRIAGEAKIGVDERAKKEDK